jgi:hypothetical protein
MNTQSLTPSQTHTQAVYQRLMGTFYRAAVTLAFLAAFVAWLLGFF